MFDPVKVPEQAGPVETNFAELLEGCCALLDIPQFRPGSFKGVSKSVSSRAIPFRSASFSQVDVTSEGKYVRNPRSTINLKPASICLATSTLSVPSASRPMSQPNCEYSCSVFIPENTERPSEIDTMAAAEAATLDRSKDEVPVNVPSEQVVPNEIPADITSNHGELLSKDMNEVNEQLQITVNQSDPSAEIFADSPELANFSQLMEDSKCETASNPHGDQLETSENLIEMPLPESDIKQAVQFYLGSEPELFTEEVQEFQLAATTPGPESETKPSETSEISDNTDEQNHDTGVDTGNNCSSTEHPGPQPQAITIMTEIENKLLLGFKMNPHRRRLEEQRTSYGDGSSGGSLELDDEKNPLVRQYSGQSDCSDDILSPGSSSSSSIIPRHRSLGTGCDSDHQQNEKQKGSDATSGQDDITILALRSLAGTRSNNNSSDDSGADVASASPVKSDMMSIDSVPYKRSISGGNRGHFVRSSPVQGNPLPYFSMKTHSQENQPTQPKRDLSRANSVTCPPASMMEYSAATDPNFRPLPPRRYNKRPLRGPYGEMLEAEMNKLVSARKFQQYTSSDLPDIHRDTKSSSPNRSNTSQQTSIKSIPADTDSAVTVVGNTTMTPKTPMFMGSLDDLQLAGQATTPPAAKLRTRKISSQMPSQSSPASGEPGNTMIAFHQRTASSPSQLLYSSSTPRRRFDNSPRGHVLAEIVDTEKSYVDSLRILVKKYMEPLKFSDFIDDGLVDEIFFQIPKILWHHEHLLEALQSLVTDDMQCVGDVLLETFRQNSLLECYSLFVNNWKNAKGSLKMAVASKPALARFLEDNARQHKGKLTLDSLLIMPIQRIPRYELLVKELLKHTSHSHEDYPKLCVVLDSIKQFALHIDCASVDPSDNREIEIEGWNSGLGHLVRQDVVTLCTSNNVKKEKAFFLFADCLAIASIKRKTTMRKTSSSAFYGSGNTWDGCKFKLLMKIPLTDARVLNEDGETQCNKGGGTGGKFAGSGVGGGGSSNSHEETDDLKIIQKMMELATLLKCSHVGLDEMLKDLATGVKHHADNGDAIDIEIKSNDNSDNSDQMVKILFGSMEKKIAWLESFHDTYNKFLRYGFGRVPQVQFCQALPIRKTRAGLQLSCAAPVFLHNKVSKTLEMSDVWVANSDGYVGQICILTLHPEPSITSCNGVCNSRITCIISVPPRVGSTPPALHTSVTAPHPAFHNSAQHDHLHRHSTTSHPHLHSLGYESEDEAIRNRSAHKVGSEQHWTVWLGTEDGALHVYDCSDSVRVKKNRHKVQHTSPLHSIIYFDNRVFASLGNGDIVIYNRMSNGKGWSMSDPSWLTVGSALNPVTKMITAQNRIWCTCGSQLKVYGESAGGTLELLQTIQVSSDVNGTLSRGVFCMATSADLVWVAFQGSSMLRCYNNTSFEILFETNVAPNVYKILAGCDDIIRQHKSACLRITALLVAPDKTLWVGTSAGVVLTIAPAAHNYKITPLCYGHTGQVRFLTCCTNKDGSTIISGGDGYEEFRPLTSPFHSSTHSGGSSTTFAGMMSSLMGESSTDSSGREDSTNHLLIWKIPKSTHS